MMTPHDVDIKRSLKWMQNQAPNITRLITQKASWYDQYHTRFWADWTRDVFDLRTANNFGLITWCIILGVPSSAFNFDPVSNNWAYGRNRENFVYSGELINGEPEFPDANLVGGNFAGGQEGTLFDREEIRRMLQLRYVAMTSDGTIIYVNEMLRAIFNEGKPWDIEGGKYFYLVDETAQAKPGDLTIKTIESRYWGGKNVLRPTPWRNGLVSGTDMNYWGSLWAGASQAGTFPDGTAFFRANTTGTTNANHNIQTGGRVVNPTQIVRPLRYSVYLKPLPGSGVDTVQLNISIENDTAGIRARLNLNTGSMTLFSGSGRFGVEVVDDGWFRAWVEVDSKAVSNIFLTLDYLKGGQISFVSDPSDGFYVAMAQLTDVPALTRWRSRGGIGQPLLPDYDPVPQTGDVHLRYTPVQDEALFWSGSWVGVDIDPPVQFGTGDGVKTNFQIAKPSGGRPPPPTGVVEYRIGPNLTVSSQLIQIMKDDEGFGILPTFAGIKNEVIQE